MNRRAVTVEGLVQGVGFRPFVFQLANRLQLAGFVQNRAGSVLIEAEGTAAALDQFLCELEAQPPRLARITRLAHESKPVVGETRFQIRPSECDADHPVYISADSATCELCLAELFDPSDRRYRYPFNNCTQCGPRLTIIEQAPYDRPRTTMASFTMCAACRREYEDPTDRRFHAQPIACPTCGPRLTLLDATGAPIASPDPLATFVELIRRGHIGALKGLGGYHLVCDATSHQAVLELRARKQRDEKPFAIMVRHADDAARLCDVNATERRLLQSRHAPIVLLRQRASGSYRQVLSPAVAPGQLELGVMLPYTPLHHLLLDLFAGVALVMTSGNRSDEPIAYHDHDAIRRLGTIADVFLTHNRPIHVRCEDSVSRVVLDEELPVRRSRGYAPEPIALSVALPCPILAAGGQYKGVFALGRDRQAILSHHLGDLQHLEAYRALERDIELYEQLFELRPELIVHDLHPDYAATEYARRRAADDGIALLPVQHHHAHLASCMAEHGLDEPVIGVIFDGTGLGTDGAVWGGEFLVGDYASYIRESHLRYVRLPGGERAIRLPWRMALAHLLDAGCDPAEWLNSPSNEQRTVEQMIRQGLNSPYTSSAGRLFDAVAAIVGLRTVVSHEAQAAMDLERLATESADAPAYPCPVDEVVDTRPLIRAIVDDLRQGTHPARIARRFHATLAEVIHQVCCRVRARVGLDAVVLSGGVFANAVLTQLTTCQLEADHFRVYCHRLVPAGDGGLCLGQLAVAARQHAMPGQAPISATSATVTSNPTLTD